MSTFFDLPFEEPEPEPAAPAPEPPARRIFTVAQLTARIRSLLERDFFEVWVEGELSNCKVWNTGHMYFTLKDRQAQIKGVIFRSSLLRLRFKPQDGVRVIARGRVTVYDPKGEYQLLCEHMEPEGVGARQLAFEQLRERLSKEGLFAQERKRPLPVLPRKIGVVTSLEGAAVRDIIKVLLRRYPNAHVVVRPTRVQGDGAALDIARGLRAIGKVPGIDVIIVGRGGGSIEDLWAFNEERVARAIVACPVPVVSAVGHEVDFTIADFVADLRAPTPSAAAEMVVAATDEFRHRIDRLTGRLRGAARADLQRRRAAVHVLGSRRGLAGFTARIAMRGRHAAELTHHLRGAVRGVIEERARDYRGLRQRLEQRDLARRLASIHGRLTAAEGRLSGAAHKTRHRADARFRALAGRLENLSPLAVLGRGYAVCWNADKTAIVRSATTVSPGDRVQVTLAHGEIGCRVESTDGRA